MYKHVFDDFIVLINDHNAEELASYMTDDHKFIDAQGNQMQGKEVMVESWKQYFKMFPDYWISIEEIIEREHIIYGFGTASGTYAGHISGDANNFWKLPVAFRAAIEGEKVKIWQVYADTKIPYEIIEKNRNTS